MGLEATIKSVIAQKCEDYEFIIIDGGSTDESAKTIERYAVQTGKITYWVSEPDKGIYNAMNKGILASKGEYLNFMNSGDIFYDENTLQTVLDSDMQEDLVVGKDQHINPKTGDSFTTIFPLQMGMYTFYKSYLPHQSTFFHRKLFAKRLYDESMKIASDWKFYIESICMDAATVRTIDVIVCNREQDGVSSQYAQRSADERKQVLEELLPQGVRRDYENLSELDFHTAQKFFKIIENPKGKKYMTKIIKIVYRLLGNKGMMG